MTILTASFKLQKETKGALRYMEIDPETGKHLAAFGLPYIVGTLYMRKSAFPDGTYPKTVEVAIEIVEEAAA